MRSQLDRNGNLSKVLPTREPPNKGSKRAKTFSFSGRANCGRTSVDHVALALVLRLRSASIRASRVLPSMPPLFHSVERHFLLGQFGGFSVSGIHRCPHTSQTRPDAAHALSAATPPHRMTRKSHLDDFEISPVYRRIHASIEMPRKYHHTVPRTNHTVNAKAICA